MPGAIRNTVDRLDKPSAYYQAKVIIPSSFGSSTIALHGLTKSATLEQEAQVQQGR